MPDFSKLFTDALVQRKGLVIQVRTRDGGFLESNSVEANLLFEILRELKRK